MLGTFVIALSCISSSGPLESLPDGWCYLPKRGRDSWLGAYHDARSGAFVTFDTYPQVSEASLRPGDDPSGSVSVGRLGPTDYRLVVTHDPRLRDLEYFRKEIGPSFPEPDSWQEWMLPPSDAGAKLEVMFKYGERRWTFEANLCDEAQETRVRELLLGAARVRVDALGDEPESANVPETESLTPGVTLETVTARSGIPLLTFQFGCDGLRLVYPASDPNSFVELLFTKERKLVRARKVPAK